MSRFERFRSPIKNARGLGSARDGVHHFVVQRMTAIGLLFLVIYIVGLVVCLAGADYTVARAAIAHPLNALLLTAFLITMFWHAQLGLQVIIEDYVQSAGLALVAQLVVRFICVLAALASVFAVVRIALGA